MQQKEAKLILTVEMFIKEWLCVFDFVKVFIARSQMCVFFVSITDVTQSGSGSCPKLIIKTSDFGFKPQKNVLF